MRAAEHIQLASLRHLLYLVGYGRMVSHSQVDPLTGSPAVSVMAIFRQLPATMAQPGRLEYERASRHAPPQQVGEEPD
jgi:hypothetical protein